MYIHVDTCVSMRLYDILTETPKFRRRDKKPKLGQGMGSHIYIREICTYSFICVDMSSLQIDLEITCIVRINGVGN